MRATSSILPRTFARDLHHICIEISGELHRTCSFTAVGVQLEWFKSSRLPLGESGKVPQRPFWKSEDRNGLVLVGAELGEAPARPW